MSLPPSQAKTVFSYLFIMGLGAYMGQLYFGKWGALIGFVLAVPVAILIGITALSILLRTRSRLRANHEGET